MNQKFTYRIKLKVELKTNKAYVSLQIFAARVLPHFNQHSWTRYLDMCRQSLHHVADEESVQIQVWSVELDRESETISHHIALSEVQDALSPVRITRALRPPQGYWMLDYLAKGLENGRQLQRPMLRAVEYHRLQ